MTKYLVLSSLLFAACTTADTTPVDDERDGTPGSKADGADACADHGWYGDVICDQNCAHPDPDCNNAIVVRAQHNGGSVIVTQGQRVMIQLGSWVAGGWHVVAVDRTLGQPQTLWAPNVDQLTWETSSLSLFEPYGGVHTVDLEYTRPQDPNHVLGRFSITLDVRPAGTR